MLAIVEHEQERKRKKQDATEPEVKKSKKLKKDKDDDKATSEADIAVKRSKRRSKGKTETAEITPLDRPDADLMDTGEGTEEALPSERRKKEKKEKKGGKLEDDPSKDPELSDKARAALSYAFSRSAAPGEWKFNKAFQNWIVKHLFSLDAIPEKYSPVVIEYLSGSQGKAKDTLIQNCKSRLNDDQSGIVVSPTSETQASSYPDPETGNPSVMEAQASEPVIAHKVVKKRAKRLLKALECEKASEES